MGLFDSGYKLGTSVAVGIGAVILAPALTSIVGGILRPVLKAGIKGGILLYEKGRETVAEAAETLEDLMIEVKTELASEGQHDPDAGQPSIEAEGGSEHAS